jgi:hypothetical protein
MLNEWQQQWSRVQRAQQGSTWSPYRCQAGSFEEFCMKTWCFSCTKFT